MSASVIVTVTTDDNGQVFYDVACEGREVSVVEAVGLLEVGKALMLEQA